MRVYLLTDIDFERLFDKLDRDPERQVALSDEERRRYREAHRFYNYQIRQWEASVKKESTP